MSLFGGGEVTTQQHLDVEDIRDDLLILKNGVVSLVMETTALNFDLLATEEQDAKILAFAGVLNSLSFPLQILISTTKKDVSSYIDKLEAHREKQISNALKRQISIYTKFVQNLTVKNEVLDKRFFITIPSIVGEVTRTSFWKQLFGKPIKITNLTSVLEKSKAQLFPKRDHISKQLKRMQISSRQLTTDELVRIFHAFYDPDRVGMERLNIQAEDYTAGIVTQEIQEQVEIDKSRIKH